MTTPTRRSIGASTLRARSGPRPHLSVWTTRRAVGVSARRPRRADVGVGPLVLLAHPRLLQADVHVVSQTAGQEPGSLAAHQGGVDAMTATMDAVEAAVGASGRLYALGSVPVAPTYPYAFPRWAAAMCT